MPPTAVEQGRGELPHGRLREDPLLDADASPITTTTLRVYPDHELEREITGLRVVETPSGWRFDHRTGGYSDRAVALAMATMLAQERRPKGFVNTTASVVPTGEIPLLVGPLGDLW